MASEWPHDEGPMTQERRTALMYWVEAELIIAERLDPCETKSTLDAIAGQEHLVRAVFNLLAAEARYG
jgi:hypothetical protein